MNRIKSPDLMSIEIYNTDGFLLTRIPWEAGQARDLKYIKDDRLFFIDMIDLCVHEYKIVEKD